MHQVILNLIKCPAVATDKFIHVTVITSMTQSLLVHNPSFLELLDIMSKSVLLVLLSKFIWFRRELNLQKSEQKNKPV